MVDPMKKPDPKKWALVCAAASVVIAVVTVATAEDDRPVDDPTPTPTANGRDTFIDLGENFVQNAFDGNRHGFALRGTSDVAGKPPAAGAVQTAETPILPKVRAIAEERFRRIDAFCGLSEPQRRKLRFALESDIRRTAESIDAVWRKYHGVIVNQSDAAWQALSHEWHKDVRSCQDRVQSLCEEDSLLMKALGSTLDAEQHARFVAETEARRDYFWRSMVAREMIALDESLGLDERQHEELQALLLAERPRMRIGFQAPVVVFHFTPHIVAMALGRIDDSRLSSVVSPRQVKFLKQAAQMGAGIRNHLESIGFLEKEPR